MLAVPMLVPASGGEGGSAPTFGLHNFDSRKFEMFKDIPALSWVTNHHVQALLAALIVIGFWIWMSRDLKVVPSRKQFGGEFLYGLVRNSVVRDSMGQENFEKYKGVVVPFLVSLFTFILVNNLFGEFFVFMFPTFSKIGFAYALGISVWCLYNYLGIKAHGLKYFPHMTIPPGVPWFLWWLVIPLEVLSNFITRPITLAMRLWANLLAGHLVIAVLVIGGGWLTHQYTNPIWVAGGWISMFFSFAVFALELLVAFLQAYIFTILSAQYVAGAVASEH